jgi:hypothetical protein
MVAGQLRELFLRQPQVFPLLADKEAKIASDLSERLGRLLQPLGYRALLLFVRHTEHSISKYRGPFPTAMIRTICPNCGAESRVPVNYMGTDVKCGACLLDYRAYAAPPREWALKSAFGKLDKGQKLGALILVSLILLMVVSIVENTFKKDNSAEYTPGSSNRELIEPQKKSPAIALESDRAPRFSRDERRPQIPMVPESLIGTWSISGSAIIDQIEISRVGKEYRVEFGLSDGSKSSKIARMQSVEGTIMLEWNDPHGDYLFLSKTGRLVLYDGQGVVATGSK